MIKIKRNSKLTATILIWIAILSILSTMLSASIEPTQSAVSIKNLNKYGTMSIDIDMSMWEDKSHLFLHVSHIGVSDNEELEIIKEGAESYFIKKGDSDIDLEKGERITIKFTPIHNTDLVSKKYSYTGAKIKFMDAEGNWMTIKTDIKLPKQYFRTNKKRTDFTMSSAKDVDKYGDNYKYDKYIRVFKRRGKEKHAQLENRYKKKYSYADKEVNTYLGRIKPRSMAKKLS